MKWKGILLCLLLVLIAGCGTAERPAAAGDATDLTSQEEVERREALTDNILDQLDVLYAQLDTTRLPVQEEYSREPDMEELPPQLVLDRPEAYELSIVIRQYLYHTQNLLWDFDGPDSLYLPGALQTALYHTAPIVWQWEFTMGAETEYIGPNDDHILNALVKREIYQGKGISDVIYADDVEKTFHRLFGDDVEIRHMDAPPYYYYDIEDVYIRVGDFGGPAWQYPQITDYEESETGVVCEVVFVTALDKETPMWVGDTELSAENFAEATASQPLYRYRLQPVEDGWILVGLETLRVAGE